MKAGSIKISNSAVTATSLKPLNQISEGHAAPETVVLTAI
jgi:hypothetical protein